MKLVLALDFEGLKLFLTGDYERGFGKEASTFDLEKVSTEKGEDLTSLLDGLYLPFAKGSELMISILDELQTLALEQLACNTPDTSTANDFRDAYEQTEAHFRQGHLAL